MNLSISSATWLLDHLAPRDESLTGDLLEELHSGRSQNWYWRQTLTAIAVALSTKSRIYLLPLAFSACWSTLYPALSPLLLHTPAAQALVAQITTHDWPYSSALQGIGGMLPAILFLWIGLFVYITLRSTAAHHASRARLIASLSISLNVFFLTCILQPAILSGLNHHPGPETSAQTSLSACLSALILPSALSLFSAILCMTPGTHPSRGTGSRAA